MGQRPPKRRGDKDGPTLDAEVMEGKRVTERELEILEWAAKGDTNIQTAERLYLSPETVKTHRKHTIAKLGARSMPQAVAYAIGMGLLNIDAIMDYREEMVTY